MAKKLKSTRRQFLAGRSAQAEIGRIAEEGMLGAADDGQSDGVDCGFAMPPLPYFSKRAMASDFEVFLNPDAESDAAEAAVELLEYIDELESQLTIYRPESEISQINRAAGMGPIRVESQLFRLLQHAAELSHRTAGAFDITSGPLSKVWGFYRRQGEMPNDEVLDETMQHIGSKLLEFREETSEVTLRDPSMEINLGGIGKGYALDRCAQVMRLAQAKDYLIHAGQSSVIAAGDRIDLRDAGKSGWPVGLRHPVWPDRYLCEIVLKNQALGTSGTSRQFFYHQGKRYGHILDPRTGWPCNGMLSATVITDDAADADALATAFFVLGLDESRAYCEQHPGCRAILVTEGQRRSEIHVEAVGMENEDWTGVIES